MCVWCVSVWVFVRVSVCVGERARARDLMICCLDLA
jgi:hypothetical protein